MQTRILVLVEQSAPRSAAVSMTEFDLVTTIDQASSWRVLSRRNPSVNFTVENKLGLHMPVIAREEPGICYRSRSLLRELEHFGGLDNSKDPPCLRGRHSWCL